MTTNPDFPAMNDDFKDLIIDPGFGIGGRHLVEASAGTGKTYNIQNVFARLVMQEHLRVSQILVVTFTEAATAELRDRIRRILVELQREFQKSGTGSKQARDLMKCLRDDNARKHAKAFVDIALLEFDLASISTIHSFCGRSLKRYAFESGIGFDTEPPGNVSEELLSAAARDWWRQHIVLDKESEWLDDSGACPFNLASLTKTLNGIFGRPNLQPDPNTVTPVLKAAFSILKDYRRDRPNRKTPDFNDILYGMRDALRDSARGAKFAENIRQEYKAALIDEFQDTDPIQYEIFQRVFFPDANASLPVYLVGDPKQAIYAFRGGDIFAYKRAAGAVDAEFRHSLKANYRSTAGIVAAVNALFGDGGNTGSTFGDSDIVYDGKLAAESNKGELLLTTAPEAKADDASAPDSHPFLFLGLEDKDDNLPRCADAIARLLNEKSRFPATKDDPERPLRPRDIAILLRAVQGNGKTLVDELRKRGIRAIVADKENSVFQSPMALSLRCLLLAMVSPDDPKKIRTALATPFFGLSVPELQALADKDGELPAGFLLLASREGRDAHAPRTIADFVLLFRDLSKRWEKAGFQAAFDLLENRVGFRTRIASSVHGERNLTDTLHLAELVQGSAATVGASPAAQAQWFTQKAEKDAAEEARFRLETEEDAVRILSIHSSKGLEFPVVFLPDAWTKHSDRNKTLAFFHGGNSGENLLVSSNTSVDAAEEKQELMRLLYVAMTRATHRCVVFHPSDEKVMNVPITTLLQPVDEKGMNAPFKMLLQRAQNAPSVVTVLSAPKTESPTKYRPTDPDAIDWLEALPVPRKLSSESDCGSYSSLAPGDKARPSRAALDDSRDREDEDAADRDPVAAPDEGRAPIFRFPGGEKTGTCWHEILEEIPFGITPEALKPVVERKLRAHGLLGRVPEEQKERVDAVADMVRKTLSCPLPALPGEDSFPLSGIADADRISEWEFDFSSKASAARTPAIHEALKKHWGGEPDGTPHRVFLDFLARRSWDRELPRGYFTGFLDLVFRHGDAYYIVDWKSNSLGGSPEAFTEEGVRDEMAVHSYFLQYLLYSAVLHRHLKETLPGYSWERNFGGIRYLFLRGLAADKEAAVFSDRPSEPLLDDLCTVFGIL